MLFDSKRWNNEVKVPSEVKPSKFKTARQLNIPAKMRQALIEVLKLFEEGKIKNQVFDMNNIGDEDIINECKTPRCILGWALTIDTSISKEKWMKYSFSEADKPALPIEELFFPYSTHYKHDAYTASVKEGAKVLRHYLTTGEVNWELAMKGRKR